MPFLSLLSAPELLVAAMYGPREVGTAVSDRSSGTAVGQSEYRSMHHNGRIVIDERAISQAYAKWNPVRETLEACAALEALNLRFTR